MEREKGLRKLKREEKNLERRGRSEKKKTESEREAGEENLKKREKELEPPGFFFFTF